MRNAVDIINLEKYLSNSYNGKHFGSQLIRSANSPTLNYAEAVGLQSKKDFIYKVSIAHKVLRESLMTIKIKNEAKLCSYKELILKALNEPN